MQIVPTLNSLAVLWAAERGLSVSRLGTLAVGDGRFFDRLAEGRSCTIATLERFLAFLRDPANWHESRGIPTPARILLDHLPPHAPADTAEAEAPSSGKADDFAGAVTA